MALDYNTWAAEEDYRRKWAVINEVIRRQERQQDSDAASQERMQRDVYLKNMTERFAVQQKRAQNEFAQLQAATQAGYKVDEIKIKHVLDMQREAARLGQQFAYDLAKQTNNKEVELKYAIPLGRIQNQLTLERLRAEGPINTMNKVNEALAMISPKLIEAEAMIPVKAKQEAAIEAEKQKVYIPKDDPWNVAMGKLNGMLHTLNTQIAAGDPEKDETQKQLNPASWIPIITQAAWDSNNPRVMRIMQDLKVISQGNPDHMDANVNEFANQAFWGAQRRGGTDKQGNPVGGEFYNINRYIQKGMEQIGGSGGRDAAVQKYQQMLLDAEKEKRLQTLPGSYGDEYRKLGPLAPNQPGQGTPPKLNSIPGWEQVPATEGFAAGWVNPDTGEFTTENPEGKKLSQTAMDAQWNKMMDAKRDHYIAVNDMLKNGDWYVKQLASGQPVLVNDGGDPLQEPAEFSRDYFKDTNTEDLVDKYYPELQAAEKIQAHRDYMNEANAGLGKLTDVQLDYANNGIPDNYGILEGPHPKTIQGDIPDKLFFGQADLPPEQRDISGIQADINPEEVGRMQGLGEEGLPERMPYSLASNVDRGPVMDSPGSIMEYLAAQEEKKRLEELGLPPYENWAPGMSLEEAIG